MAVEIKDGASSDKLAINATGAASVALTTDDAAAGFVALVAESHPTENGVTREVYALESNDDYALRTTQEEVLFAHLFAGAAVNTTLFRQGSATATITQTGGFLTLNAGLSTASGAAAVVTGYQMAEVTPTSNLYWSGAGQFGQASHPANCLMEWGLATHNAGPGTGTTEPTDGAYFRVSAAGAFEAVIRSAGVDVATATITAAFGTVVGGNTTREFVVSLSDSTARFWIDDAPVARIDLPTSAAAAPGWTVTRTLAPHFRLHNTGVTGSAQSMKFSEVAIKRDNVGAPRPLAHAVAASGQMASQGQTGETFGTTASYANSADPTAAAALSNTVVLVTGLGGQARFNAGATSTTDGIVTSYQVPAATSAIPGKALYITGVKISAANLGVAVATTASTIAWSLAYGHTAAALNTSEAATTKAPRRVALGLMTWPVGAAVGQMPQCGDLVMQFDSPICVQPGEFVASVAKFVVGTATASQVIWAHVTFDGYRA